MMIYAWLRLSASELLESRFLVGISPQETKYRSYYRRTTLGHSIQETISSETTSIRLLKRTLDQRSSREVKIWLR